SGIGPFSPVPRPRAGIPAALISTKGVPFLRFQASRSANMGLFRSTSIAGLRRHVRPRAGSMKSTLIAPETRRRTRFLTSLVTLEERALLSTVTVTSTNDSGPGSLRDAIDNAVSGEVIKFAKSAYGTIHLTSGPLFIDMIDLTIQGPGPDKVKISAGGNFTDI